MTSRITRYAISFMLLGALAFAVYAWMSAAGGKNDGNPLQKYAAAELEKLDFASAGTPAPDIPFEAADGSPVKFSDFEGKVLLVNIWATWCAPCEQEMPSLAALDAAKGGDDFRVIAISIDGAGDRDYAQTRLRDLSSGQLDFYHASIKDNSELASALNLLGFPTTLIYDADGNLLARLEGEADWASLHAVAFIEDAIKR